MQIIQPKNKRNQPVIFARPRRNYFSSLKRGSIFLSSFYKQNMHRGISQHNENTSKDRQLDDIWPQRQRIKAKRAQDGRTGDGDVEPVFLVHERQEGDLVDNQGFEGVVEDRDSLQPEHRLWYRIVVEQQASKEEGEEHDQTANEGGYPVVFANDTNEEAYRGGGEVEEDENEEEFEEVGCVGNQTWHGVKD